jgi:hypothetical protein
MSKHDLHEQYPLIWHYTTASGLQGILKSQQLWATNILFLNDEEEFTGFFNKRLATLLQEAVAEGVKEIRKKENGQQIIDSLGGEAGIRSVLITAFRNATLKHRAFVTSFCSPPETETSDGLLSQWRGYGPDGGYAIVFDSRKINELLKRESGIFLYAFLHWGDVDYHDEKATTRASHPETIEWEETIRAGVTKIVATRELGGAESLFAPMMSLSTRHKHAGFREEREIRIAAITLQAKDIDNARKAGDNRQIKPISFAPRGGVLSPYIALFDFLSKENGILPIKQIVVGPHPEKLKRKIAIEIMLDQIGINADVVVSQIPYIGR